MHSICHSYFDLILLVASTVCICSFIYIPDHLDYGFDSWYGILLEKEHFGVTKIFNKMELKFIDSFSYYRKVVISIGHQSNKVLF